jgi:hypothetical protein
MRFVRTSLIAASLLCAAWPLQAQNQQVVAFAQSGDGARVLLYTKAGPCVGQARFAEHIAPDGEKTPGCWVMGEGMVLVSFLDGERGNIPVAQLKRAETL